jgi:hypothetical protein
MIHAEPGMGYVSKATISVAAIVGAVIFSQAPEFAQQYRQRLGGALDELRVIVDDFDHDAQQYNLNRDGALALFSGSSESFIRARGVSMRNTLTRYQRLSDQVADMNRTAPVLRPFVVLSDPDQMIARKAWSDFVPAIPVSASEIAWGGSGALLLGGLTGFFTLLGRRRVTAPA